MTAITSSHLNLTKFHELVTLSPFKSWTTGHWATERLFAQESSRVKIVPSSYDYRVHIHDPGDF